MNWNIITPSIVSVFAIFISYFLGNSKDKKKFIRDSNLVIYESYYMPLIRKLMTSAPGAMNFYTLVACFSSEFLDQLPEEARKSIVRKDFLLSLLQTKIEYVTPEIAKIARSYLRNSGSGKMFYAHRADRLKYEKYADNASKEFDEIIKLSLTEASRLSKLLKYPDIAQPLLDSLNKEIAESNYPRYQSQVQPKDHK